MRDIKVIILDDSLKKVCDEYAEIIDFKSFCLNKSEKDFYLVVMNDDNENREKLDTIIDFVDCVYIKNFKNISKIIYNIPVIADQNEELIQTPYIFIEGDFKEVICLVDELMNDMYKLSFPILDRIKSEEVSCRMVDITGDDGFKIKLH